MNLSRELMQLCLGTLQTLSAVPTEREWQEAFSFATRQTTVPLLGYAVGSLPQQCRPDEELMQKLVSAYQANGIKASALDKAADEFIRYMAGKGFAACVLKGRGLARYWPEPDSRQSGDLDIWVDGRRDDVIAALREDFEVLNILWQECHLVMWDGAGIDVHFYPTKAASPLCRRRLVRWYGTQKIDGKYPSLEFDLVYCMAHLYRHALRTGVNFRQLMDYAFLLKASTPQQRRQAFGTLRRLGMGRIAADVMFALKATLGLDDGLLLCSPRTEGGKRLVDDALLFCAGQERPRTTKREFEIFLSYPDEMLWTPAARLSQYIWKKLKQFK